jgi:hypothetical protein
MDMEFFLYINNHVDKTPLVSSFIAFIFTTITLSFIGNFTKMLILFLLSLEFFVFYFNYKKFITPFYISNADFYSIKKIKKCKINFDGLTFSSSLWLLKK